MLRITKDNMDRNSHTRPEYIRSFVDAPNVDHYGSKVQQGFNPQGHLFKGYPTAIYDPVNLGLAYSLPLENWPQVHMPQQNRNSENNVNILTIYPGMNV